MIVKNPADFVGSVLGASEANTKGVSNPWVRSGRLAMCADDYHYFPGLWHTCRLLSITFLKNEIELTMSSMYSPCCYKVLLLAHQTSTDFVPEP